MDKMLQRDVFLVENLSGEMTEKIYNHLSNEIKQAVSFRKQQSPHRYNRRWAKLFWWR